MTDIIAHVCGGAQAEKCVGGKEHKMTKIVTWDEGRASSVACEVCGRTAMDIDLMRGP